MIFTRCLKTDFSLARKSLFLARFSSTWLMLLIGLYMLAACGGNVASQREALLINYQTPITTQQIPETELDGMVDQYQQASESQFPEIEALARQRIADLALEEGEKQLLEYNLDDPDSVDNTGYDEAIAVYLQLLQDYPDSNQNDHIRYQLARAYDYAGESSAVLYNLTTLVTQHPTSTLFTEAQFRRGDLLFTQGRFDEANIAYKAVVDRGPDESYYKHALYKYAWSLYREDSIDDAQQRFADLLGYLETPDDLEKLEARNRELVKDVLRVLALSFSQQNGAESIQRFADARANQPYTSLIYQALAEQLATQRLYGDAAEVYSYYSDHHVEQQQAPIYHLKAIKLFEQNSLSKKSLEARKTFVQRYGVGAIVWQSAPATLFSVIKPDLKENIIYLAKYHHGLFQQTQQLSDAQQTQYWYQYFLSSFPEEQESGEIHFLYAENLYETGEYAQAASAYDQAAYHYPSHANSAEAGYAALLSHEKRTDLETPLLHHQLITSCSQFLQNFAADPRVNSVRHKKIDQHIALAQFESAATELTQLIADLDPNSPQLGTVWSKLTYSHFMLNDYLSVEYSAHQALTHLTDKLKRKEVEERLAAAIYKQGEAAQTEGDFVVAARHFLRVMSIVPSAAIVLQAEYDAAAAYINGRSWSEASEVLVRFIKKHPDHSLTLGAREKLAFAYDEMGEESKAAHAYSALAKVEPDLERRRIWLSQAADLHQQSGNTKLAIDMLEGYLRLMVEQDSTYYEVNLRIAEIFNKEGNIKAYKGKLNLIIDNVGKDNPDTALRQHAANASLALASIQYEAFDNIVINEPIKEALARKKKAMQSTLKLYKQASDYRISSATTAATFHIGELYQKFSHALMTSERPKAMSEDELEMYTLLLEEQAFPFEEKSIDLHQLNIKRVSSGIYDQWVKESFKALSKLQPARFNKRERAEAIISSLN